MMKLFLTITIFYIFINASFAEYVAETSYYDGLGTKMRREAIYFRSNKDGNKVLVSGKIFIDKTNEMREFSFRDKNGYWLSFDESIESHRSRVTELNNFTIQRKKQSQVPSWQEIEKEFDKWEMDENPERKKDNINYDDPKWFEKELDKLEMDENPEREKDNINYGDPKWFEKELDKLGENKKIKGKDGSLYFKDPNWFEKGLEKQFDEWDKGNSEKQDTDCREKIQSQYNSKEIQDLLVRNNLNSERTLLKFNYVDNENYELSIAGSVEYYKQRDDESLDKREDLFSFNRYRRFKTKGKCDLKNDDILLELTKLLMGLKKKREAILMKNELENTRKDVKKYKKEIKDLKLQLHKCNPDSQDYNKGSSRSTITK